MSLANQYLGFAASGAGAASSYNAPYSTPAPAPRRRPQLDRGRLGLGAPFSSAGGVAYACWTLSISGARGAARALAAFP